VTDMSDNDCRCAYCGICKHDHRGWSHEWIEKPINVRGNCRLCGEPWAYDQPVCVNAECPSHE
jgi:hypothetical protein